MDSLLATRTPSPLSMYAGLLPTFPDFLLIWFHCSWAWRKWSLNINQLSWIPLPCRSCSHGILPRSLSRLQLTLLKSMVKILLPCFIPSWYWTPPHGHDSQRCLQPSHLQQGLPCLLSQGQAVHHSLWDLPLPVTGSCHQCPETSWTVCALLCCFSNRCPGSLSLPQEPGPVTLRLLQATCKRPHAVLPVQVACSQQPPLLVCPFIPTHNLF